MATADRENWDRRHARAGSDADRADAPRPPDALRGREELLPPAGPALDVACGRGAVSVWLALRGFAVDAVDVSGVGLRSGAELARHHEVADRVRWWPHDLDHGLPDGLGHGYRVVVCQRFRDPRLYPELMRVLAPGGLLVVSVLSRTGRADGPFRAEAGELLAAFTGLRVLAHREGDGEESLLATAPG